MYSFFCEVRHNIRKDYRRISPFSWSSYSLIIKCSREGGVLRFFNHKIATIRSSHFSDLCVRISSKISFVKEIAAAKLKKIGLNAKKGRY